uniref:C-X-C motif chemokine 16 n=1 Tax=Geotrypetes seraphini TaxID=260995 RepID=A0A6P8SIS6_GEOSA|nr:C-X-C motif chemokine 16 isoform X2 [Geotrypetes seraphini]XP_033818670.1 C-X-C motif chemokine 16 isoform X2 [Geotrypetes seraphini]
MLLLYLLLFFHSSLPVFCQHGVNSGLCSCQPLLIPPNKSKLAWYSFQLEDYDTCPNNIIRFKLRRTTVCGIAFEDWVQKLKACFIAKNFTECRIKVPKTNMDMKILSTSVTTTNQDRSIARSSMQDIHENQTDLLLDLPDTTNATFFIQNQETDLTVQGSVDKNFKGLAHIPVTAAAPPEEENIKKMTVTIILLLGIVFILFGITTFLICQKRTGVLECSKMKYFYVNQSEGSTP